MRDEQAGLVALKCRSSVHAHGDEFFGLFVLQELSGYSRNRRVVLCLLDLIKEVGQWAVEPVCFETQVCREQVDRFDPVLNGGKSYPVVHVGRSIAAVERREEKVCA